MNFESLTILPGTNKAGEPEHFAPVTLHPMGSASARAASVPLPETQGLEKAVS